MRWRDFLTVIFGGACMLMLEEAVFRFRKEDVESHAYAAITPTTTTTTSSSSSSLPPHRSFLSDAGRGGRGVRDTPSPQPDSAESHTSHQALAGGGGGAEASVQLQVAEADASRHGGAVPQQQRHDEGSPDNKGNWEGIGWKWLHGRHPVQCLAGDLAPPGGEGLGGNATGFVEIYPSSQPNAYFQRLASYRIPGGAGASANDVSRLRKEMPWWDKDLSDRMVCTSCCDGRQQACASHFGHYRSLQKMTEKKFKGQMPRPFSAAFLNGTMYQLDSDFINKEALRITGLPIHPVLNVSNSSCDEWVTEPTVILKNGDWMRAAAKQNVGHWLAEIFGIFLHASQVYNVKRVIPLIPNCKITKPGPTKQCRGWPVEHELSPFPHLKSTPYPDGTYFAWDTPDRFGIPWLKDLLMEPPLNLRVNHTVCYSRLVWGCPYPKACPTPKYISLLMPFFQHWLSSTYASMSFDRKGFSFLPPGGSAGVALPGVAEQTGITAGQPVARNASSQALRAEGSVPEAPLPSVDFSTCNGNRWNLVVLVRDPTRSRFMKNWEELVEASRGAACFHDIRKIEMWNANGTYPVMQEAFQKADAVISMHGADLALAQTLMRRDTVGVEILPYKAVREDPFYVFQANGARIHLIRWLLNLQHIPGWEDFNKEERDERGRYKNHHSWRRQLRPFTLPKEGWLDVLKYANFLLQVPPHPSEYLQPDVPQKARAHQYRKRPGK